MSCQLQVSGVVMTWLWTTLSPRSSGVGARPMRSSAVSTRAIAALGRILTAVGIGLAVDLEPDLELADVEVAGDRHATSQELLELDLAIAELVAQWIVEVVEDHGDTNLVQHARLDVNARCWVGHAVAPISRQTSLEFVGFLTGPRPKHRGTRARC